MEKKLIDAVEKVLKDDHRLHESAYSWLFITKVLREMGFKMFIEFDNRMPSPESIFTTRRTILHKRNSYGHLFVPEDGVTITKRKDDRLSFTKI